MNVKAKAATTFLALVFISVFFMGRTQAELVVIDDTASHRIDDTSGDGLGDTVGAANANKLVGAFSDGQFDMHSVFVFQMTGFSSGTQIANANFSVTQYHDTGTPTFGVDAHVIRTSSSSTVVKEDYENSAQLLMSDYGGGANDLKSLSSDGQSLFTTYLQNNWGENDFVFIALKSDPIISVQTNDYFWYSEFLSDGDPDAQIRIMAVPEPSTLASLGIGLILMSRRRRSSNSQKRI